MSSSFPKHLCLHRIVALVSLLALIASFVVLSKKDCHRVPLTQKNALWYFDPTLTSNETLMQLAKEKFVIHYYDTIQIYHIIIIAATLLILSLSFINIAPDQEDLKFGFHLLVIIIMGSVTALSCYSSYETFHMPCHVNKEAEKDNLVGSKYSTYTRMLKDKTPVNAWVENDEFLMLVSGMDCISSIMYLIATFVLIMDARELAIQDDYVARIRVTDY